MADQMEQQQIAAEQGPEQHQQPTPAQLLELERARIERVNAELKLAEYQKQLDTLQTERTELNRSQAIRKAFEESKVRFHDADVALDVVEKMYSVEYDDEGNPSGIIDKKRQPLDKVLQHFALSHPNMADGRSLKALKDSQPQLKTRSEMTTAEKARFISDHGREAYEKLPYKPVPSGPGVPTTLAEYRALSLSERSRLVSKYGDAWVAELARAKK